VHIDFVGPLPVSSGSQYCLTAINRYNRWPEALPLSDITAEAFISVWVYRFVCPQQITTVQGRQFEARLFKTLATITGSSKTRTTAWHPASNGMIERLHCQLKASFMYHADKHWSEVLPLILLGIRIA
jgi:cleavage and polyadenylation specificity factor subunit 1